MYSLKDIFRGLRDPYLIFREINALYHRLGNSGTYNEGGVNIFNKDWDNLIILDACRADIFQQEVDLPGEFETRQSKASKTKGFIKANFSNRELHDAVYVAGNSWILKIGDDIGVELHAVYDAKDDLDYGQDKIRKKALEANDNHPNKRLIIHFVPPHHPFMGPTAEDALPLVREQESAFFSAIRKSEYDISDDTLKQIYIENLERVIPAVEELLCELEGKTVITADHGELLGDRLTPIPIRGYGHPSRLFVEELVTVPWQVYESGSRKKITQDEPVDNAIDTRTPEEIDEHLKDLGYKM